MIKLTRNMINANKQLNHAPARHPDRCRCVHLFCQRTGEGLEKSSVPSLCWELPTRDALIVRCVFDSVCWAWVLGLNLMDWSLARYACLSPKWPPYRTISWTYFYPPLYSLHLLQFCFEVLYIHLTKDSTAERKRTRDRVNSSPHRRCGQNLLVTKHFVENCEIKRNTSRPVKNFWPQAWLCTGRKIC